MIGDVLLVIAAIWSGLALLVGTVGALIDQDEDIPADGLRDDVESKRFNDALAFGESCTQRVTGEGAWYDVDGEVTDESFKEQTALYNAIQEWRVFERLRDAP